MKPSVGKDVHCNFDALPQIDYRMPKAKRYTHEITIFLKDPLPQFLIFLVTKTLIHSLIQQLISLFPPIFFV